MYSLPNNRKTSNCQPVSSRLFGSPASRRLRLIFGVVSLSVALSFQTAGANESGLPFELPKRVPFVIPDPSPPASTAPSPAVAPSAAEIPAEPKPSKKRKTSKKAVQEESSAKGPDANPPVANSAPAASESAPPESAPAAPAADTTSSTSAADSSTSVTPTAGKRFLLQGKTEHVDFRLSEFEGYKQGMAALDKRHYAEAETLFKAAAAKLDDGYEKYRAECNFFEAKCLMMQGKFDESKALLKSTIALFDKYDPSNPYKLAAQKQVGDLLSGKARMDVAKMHAHTNLHQARVVDQNITFYSRVATDDSDPVLLRCDKEATSSTIHDCFAEMTCLETAELGTNVGNALGRWQPLLVKGEPAAFEFGAKSPVINVKVNGQTKEVPVNLPMVNGLRRVLLATDSEKICAIDVDNNDTWLLQMENLPDGTIGRVRWALLRHVKQKSATWGVSRNVLNQPRPTGNAWGTAPNNGFGREVNVNPRLYRNSQGRY